MGRSLLLPLGRGHGLSRIASINGLHMYSLAFLCPLVVFPVVWSSIVSTHCRVPEIADQKMYWTGLEVFRGITHQPPKIHITNMLQNRFVRSTPLRRGFGCKTNWFAVTVYWNSCLFIRAQKPFPVKMNHVIRRIGHPHFGLPRYLYDVSFHSLLVGKRSDVHRSCLCVREYFL